MGAPKKKDLLALEPRREIYDLVRRAPGVHLRGIERELGLPFGQVLYHLDALERSDLVDVRRDGGFKRYFAKRGIDRSEKAVLATLRHELPRKIAILLLVSPGISHRAIHAHFGVSASTLSFHLAKMVENGIVEREEVGNENRYRILDEEAAARALVLHRESFMDDAVDRFAEYWLSVGYRSPSERAARAAAGSLPLRVTRGVTLPEAILGGATVPA